MSGNRLQAKDIRESPLFDPDPATFVGGFNSIPKDHKISDYLIGMLGVAIQTGDLTKADLRTIHLTFTYQGKVRSNAHGYGRPCIGTDGLALTWDNIVLHGRTFTKKGLATPSTVLGIDPTFKTMYQKTGLGRRVPREAKAGSNQQEGVESAEPVRNTTDNAMQVFRSLVENATNVTLFLDKSKATKTQMAEHLQLTASQILDSLESPPQYPRSNSYSSNPARKTSNSGSHTNRRQRRSLDDNGGRTDGLIRPIRSPHLGTQLNTNSSTTDNKASRSVTPQPPWAQPLARPSSPYQSGFISSTDTSYHQNKIREREEAAKKVMRDDPNSMFVSPSFSESPGVTNRRLGSNGEVF